MKGIGTITCPKTNDRAYMFKCGQCQEAQECAPLNELKLQQKKAIAKMILPTIEAAKAFKALGVTMLKCCPVLAKIKYKPHRLRSAVRLKRRR